MKQEFSFTTLIQSIQTAHRQLTEQASRAVNVSLTLRNWLIGCYIAEYEQSGMDRAAYGEKLLPLLANELQQHGVARSEERELRRYRRFYQTYPQIREALPPEFKSRVLVQENSGDSDSRVASKGIGGNVILTSISFSHLVELIAIDDSTKRAFYEVECVRSNWSVRELKRQIASLYFERSGLSQDKASLAHQVAAKADTQTTLNIRDPYIFEFLGLKSAEVMTEGDNPLVGILLCTDRNHALAEYALAGME